MENLTNLPEAHAQLHGREQRVVFMLGGITGVKLACVKKIAEDITGGNMVMAMDLFERIQHQSRRAPQGARADDGASFETDQRPIPPRIGCSEPSSSHNHTSLFISRSLDSPFSTPVYRTDEPHAPISRVRPDAFTQSCSPSRTEFHATAASPPLGDGPSIMISKSYTLNFDGDSSPETTPSPLETPTLELKRPRSLIILPPSVAQTGCGISSSSRLHSRPSLIDIRRKSTIVGDTSWYGNRDIKRDDSALDDLVERSLSIKNATRYGQRSQGSDLFRHDHCMVEKETNSLISGMIKCDEEFGGKLPIPNNRNSNRRFPGSDSSFLHFAEEEVQSPTDSFYHDGLSAFQSNIGRTRVDIRSSWLAPPTAIGDRDELLGHLGEEEHSMEYDGRYVYSDDLFPSIRSKLEYLTGNGLGEKDWCEGFLYIDVDTPKVCMERVVYEWLLAESSEGAFVPNSIGAQSHRRPMPPILHGARFPLVPTPESLSWKVATGGVESIPLCSAPRVGKIRMSSRRKQKTGMEVQNEIRSFVREMTQAASEHHLNHDDSSAFEEYHESFKEAGSDIEGKDEEAGLGLWRDMFSTQGEWPLSTVNLIVALGKEGPTNAVKGGSGRVMAEAMARRLEKWDLRCRRITLR